MPRLLRNILLALGALAVLLPAAAGAQLRDIVSKNVSASSSGASLSLEFVDDGSLEVGLALGSVTVDGEVVGSYAAGDELDVAWRRLLGEAMALEGNALAVALVEWSPPSDLPDAISETAIQIDRALDDALRSTAGSVALGGTSVSVAQGDQSGLVRALLGAAGRLGLLEKALSGLDDDLEIHVGEDVLIARGTVVNGTLVVIDGTLRIEGEVHGDVVVVGGALDIRDSGVVEGEARIADARVLRNTGDIEGDIVDVLETERETEAELRDQLRDEIRDELRNDLRREIRNATRFRDDDSFSIMTPFRPVIRGVGGLFEKLLLVFVLGLVGAGFIAFAGENLDTIAETARRAPTRSAMVGIAGSFLLIPVWILGAVALAVSIIGIPVAIAWLPLFPIAAVLASLLGYLAVARNAGEWLADSSWPWTGWIRKSNPLMTLFGGLIGLSFAFMAANVISMAPFLGVFGTLLVVIGSIITFLAMQIGFGAVLLTRAGRRREYYGPYDADAAWEAAMAIDVDDVSEVSDADTTGAGRSRNDA